MRPAIAGSISIRGDVCVCVCVSVCLCVGHALTFLTLALELRAPLFHYQAHSLTLTAVNIPLIWPFRWRRGQHHHGLGARGTFGVTASPRVGSLRHVWSPSISLRVSLKTNVFDIGPSTMRSCLPQRRGGVFGEGGGR